MTYFGGDLCSKDPFEQHVSHRSFLLLQQRRFLKPWRIPRHPQTLFTPESFSVISACLRNYPVLPVNAVTPLNYSRK